MLYSTRAVILSSTEYGENQKIFKCLTENEGVAGFIVSVSKKNKTLNYRFSILSGYDLTYRKSSSLFRVTQADWVFSFLEKDPKTMSIIFFLGEVLNYVLRESSEDQAMFRYIFHSLQDFSDEQAPNTNFHLAFLMELTKHLGFYPNRENITTHCFFDLKEGVFVDGPQNKNTLDEKNTNLIKSLLGMSFDQTRGKYTLVEKRHLIELILKYYSIHLDRWKKVQSLDILHSIFE